MDEDTRRLRRATTVGSLGGMLRQRGLIPIIVFASFGGQAPPHREYDVVIPSAGGRHLAGTLTLPASGSRFPVAVTITGSGAHFRDGNRSASDGYRPFRQIAAALAARGVATLRMDDRGVGGSTGIAAATDGDDVAEDVLTAVRWLRRHPSIDSAKVALVGHSFGGYVAPIVAAADPTIAAVVLMGASAASFRETMRYQNDYEIDRDPAIPASRKASALEAASRQQERNAAASAVRWRSWAQNRDPLPTASRIAVPVLILHGTTDRAVPPRDAARLDSAIRAGGNSTVTVRYFENLNHHFQRDTVGARDGYARLPTQDLAPEFLEALAEWVSRVLRSRR